MNYDIIEKNGREKGYSLGLILSLLLMFLLPNISSCGLMGYVALYDPENYIYFADPTSVFYKAMMEKGVFLCQAAGYVGTIGCFLILFKSIYKQDLIEFKKHWLKNIIIVVVSFGIMYLMTYLTDIIFKHFGIPVTSDNQESIEEAIFSSVLIYVAFTVTILAPFVEETIFRTMLFGTIEKRLKWPKVVAIIISTIIFSLIHLTTEIQLFIKDPSNAIYLLSFFLYMPLALMLSLGYHYSKNNFFVVFLIHLLNNTLSLISILS